MIKEVFTETELTCISQDSEMCNEQPRTGILTMNEKGVFRFEEAANRLQKSLNPKLYEGSYISLVLRKDGRYQIHLKMICPNAYTDAKNLTKGIGKELSQALEVVKQ